MASAIYNELASAGTHLDSSFLLPYKTKIIDYFMSLGQVLPAFPYMRRVCITSALCAATDARVFDFVHFNANKSAIAHKTLFIDETVYNDANALSLDSQITHCLLRDVTKTWQSSESKWQMLGHTEQYFLAMHEATLQMLAEQIENQALVESENPLFFLKSVMRVIKVLVGEEKVASQLLNNTKALEAEISRLTNNAFDFNALAFEMQKSYDLTKAKVPNQVHHRIQAGLKALISAKRQEDNFILVAILDEFNNEPPACLLGAGINPAGRRY